jgi:hypothetical protein
MAKRKKKIEKQEVIQKVYTVPAMIAIIEEVKVEPEVIVSKPFKTKELPPPKKLK